MAKPRSIRCPSSRTRLLAVGGSSLLGRRTVCAHAVRMVKPVIAVKPAWGASG
jgi:hypothetical protein